MNPNDSGTTQNLPSFDSEMAEIVESFIVESNEILDKLGPNLLELEKNPRNAELHNVIFRAVHTLKGTSSFLGFEQLTGLAHHFEDVLNKIRRNELDVTSDKIDVMFEAYDLLKTIVQRIESRIFVAPKRIEFIHSWRRHPVFVLAIQFVGVRNELL